MFSFDCDSETLSTDDECNDSAISAIGCCDSSSACTEISGRYGVVVDSSGIVFGVFAVLCSDVVVNGRVVVGVIVFVAVVMRVVACNVVEDEDTTVEHSPRIDKILPLCLYF